MKKINEFISDRIYEDVEQDVQQNIVENPPKITMMDIKESPLNWQKISKLTPEQFYNIFKDKTVVIYIPVSSVNSFKGDWGVNFADGSKSTKRGTKGSGYFNFRDGMQNTIIFITNIQEDKVTVNGVEISRLMSDHYMGGEMSTKDVLPQLSSLKNKIFNEGKYTPKVFVVDAPEYKSRGGNFNKETFFGPYIEKLRKLDKAYDDLMDEVKSLPYSRKLHDGAQSLRKGSTWNYIAFGGSWFDFIAVGYGESIGFKKEYNGIPSMVNPSSVSTSEMKTGGYYNSYCEAYKVTPKQYEKFKEVINKAFNNFSAIRKETAKLYNDWLDKFVLGKEISLSPTDEETNKQVEKVANKKPDENNDGDSGSAVIKKTKKAFADAEKKMTAWHEGTRRQNVGACSPEKLQAYYQVCKELGFEKEAKELETEMKKKGVEIPKIEESLFWTVREEFINESED